MRPEKPFTPEKLLQNLELLRQAVARKPEKFTPEHARLMPEALCHYTRTRTINMLLSMSDWMAEDAWPFPAYCPDFAGNLTEAFRELVLGARREEAVEEKGDDAGNPWTGHFEQHLEEIREFWITHRLLHGRKTIIRDVMECYRNEWWAACITTIIPLTDLVCRQCFGVGELRTSVNHICRVFQKTGLSAEDMRPGYDAWDRARELGQAPGKETGTDFRLIGIGLDSFLRFAKPFYAHFSESKTECHDLNRHGIIHGAATEWWSHNNADRILTFFDLMLRFEPAFMILLNPE